MKGARLMMGAAFLAVVSACKPSVSESDAIYYGYCVGIFAHAEVAIQRGYLEYPIGTFQRVRERASNAFLAPVDWNQESLRLFEREFGRAQNHGDAITRGDVQSRDITRLDACIVWANGLGN